MMLARDCKATKCFWGYGGAVIHLPHPTFVAPPSPKKININFTSEVKAWKSALL